MQRRQPYCSKKPDENDYVNYDAAENSVWELLIKRQLPLLQSRACKEYLLGLEALDLPLDRIPQCYELNAILATKSQWRVQAVSSVLGVKTFFAMLADRKFPVATFIRRHEDLDYIDEPDIFHEIIGHIPILLHSEYADFLQQFGQKAMQATPEIQKLYGRLFFYTVETGLVATSAGLKVYGSGILSSKNEIIYALDSPIPTRNQFDLQRIVQTTFGLEKMQSNYFIISSFDDLYAVLQQKVSLVDVN